MPAAEIDNKLAELGTRLQSASTKEPSPKQLLKSEEKHVKLTKWSKKQASSRARPARGEA